MSPTDFHDTVRCMGFTETMDGLYFYHPDLKGVSLGAVLVQRTGRVRLAYRDTIAKLKKRLDEERAHARP